jgi:acyl dehydratase
MVLQTVIGRSRFLGSPGAMRMQLHSPVYPGREVRVTHSFESIEHLAGWPGIGLVTSMTRGVDNAGELVITMSHLSWMASRGVQPHLDRLRMDNTASACLGAFKAKSTGGLRLDADARIFFEDCAVGALYQSGEHVVDPSGYDKFCRTFDAVSEDGATLRNEWYGPSLGIRILGDGFWLHAAAVGGTGLDLIRWPNPIHAGDRIHGEMRITEARPLRSRPHLGLVKSACICINQRGEVVTSYEVTTFIRKRASDPG